MDTLGTGILSRPHPLCYTQQREASNIEKLSLDPGPLSYACPDTSLLPAVLTREGLDRGYEKLGVAWGRGYNYIAMWTHVYILFNARR